MLFAVASASPLLACEPGGDCLNDICVMTPLLSRLRTLTEAFANAMMLFSPSLCRITLGQPTSSKNLPKNATAHGVGPFTGTTAAPVYEDTPSRITKVVAVSASSSSTAKKQLSIAKTGVAFAGPCCLRCCSSCARPATQLSHQAA